MLYDFMSTNRDNFHIRTILKRTFCAFKSRLFVLQIDLIFVENRSDDFIDLSARDFLLFEKRKENAEVTSKKEAPTNPRSRT